MAGVKLIEYLQRFFNKPLPFVQFAFIEDEQYLKLKSLPENSSILVASKISGYEDSYAVLQLIKKIGIPYIRVVNYSQFLKPFGKLGHFIALKLGKILVVGHRDQAVKAAHICSKLIADGNIAFLMRPEARVALLNDIVLPLMPGIAMFALQGANLQLKLKNRVNTWIIPIGVKVVHREDISSLIKVKLCKIEQKLLGNSQQGLFPKRITTVIEALYNMGKKKFSVEISEGDSPEIRLQSLGTALVEKLEMQNFGMHRKGDPADRAVYLETFLRKTSRYLDAWWALRSFDFSPGYLEILSQERALETILKIERILAGKSVPYPQTKRVLLLKVQKPINVEPYLQQYLAAKKNQSAVFRLLAELKDSLTEAQVHLFEASKSYVLPYHEKKGE